MTPEEISFTNKVRAARAKAAGLEGLGAGVDAQQLLSQATQAARGVQARGLIGAVVPSVTIRTQLSPEITADMTSSPPGEKGKIAGGDPITNSVMNLIKPALYANTAMGPVSIEPYGRPSSGKYFWIFAVGAIAFTGLAGYGAWSLVKSLLKK